MSDEYWLRMIKDGVQEFERQVDVTLDIILSEVFPALTETQAPDDRYAFYQGLSNGTDPAGRTWDTIKLKAENLWGKLSQDALNLEARHQAQQKKTLADWLHTSRNMDMAFMDETQPRMVFGLQPDQQQEMGLMELPMGSNASYG